MDRVESPICHHPHPHPYFTLFFELCQVPVSTISEGKGVNQMGLVQKPNKPGPKRFSVPELARVGVEILARRNMVLLRCKRCGEKWQPMLGAGGRLPRGYWKCPRGCNS